MKSLDPLYLDELMLDDYYLADFTRGAEPPINFYIAWYDTQRAGRSAHSPAACLPAGGWQIQSFTQRSLPGIRAAARAAAGESRPDSHSATSDSWCITGFSSAAA